ncbi:transcription initiation factor IIA subunit 1-like isoform X1 [Cucurbita moschata]|uniref:Transcription initiation factor IIA subunit 1-like isoform X1 n=1 Tax=Cucurbita moschata TaxID=3662 RepID=A0A6J1FUX4_CUCMO|nr:transcription initiation factor IIA subunit 1-like isoform X1 [Cucurbita moschata]
MAISTSSIYINVIEDVVNKLRDEFTDNGPGEDVLKELQGMWEAKMMQAGAVNGPIERSAPSKPTPGGPITPVHDLNVPYEGTEEYETPTADLLFPPTPLQTPIQTPLPGTADNAMYNVPTGPSDHSASGTDASPAVTTPGGSASNVDVRSGRPTQFMQPPSWMGQKAPVDVNIAYVEGRDEADRGVPHPALTQDFFMMNSGKRKRDGFASQYQTNGFIPQQDGAGDAANSVFEIESLKLLKGKLLQISGCNASDGRPGVITSAKSATLTHIERSLFKIPQLDGPIPDPYDDVLSTPNIYNYQGVFNEDYNIANTPAPNDPPAGTPAVVTQDDVGEEEEDDEPSLNEDDDDDDLDDVDQGEEVSTQHLVLAQFDKVTRTKSRWKCTLKDGIMHINNKDILFNKATGEFDF